MQGKTKTWGIALLALTTLSWGGMFPVAKAALTALDGFYLTLWRYGLASVIFLGLLALREGPGAFSLEGRGARLFLLGALGFAGFSLLAFVGLARSKAEHGAIIMALMPLLTVVLTWVLRGKRPGVVTVACILAALAGVGLVVTKGSAGTLQGGALLPDLMILGGAACWVMYTMGSAAFAGWSTLRYTALTSALGTVAIAVTTAAATALDLSTMPSAETVWSVRMELAYLVVIAAVLAVFSWNVGIRAVGPVNGVLFINLVPITAFAIGLAQGHVFGPAELTGAALTITALVVNNLHIRGALRWPARAAAQPGKA